jgi:membrane protease YdiL (CAAX protease family)
MSVAAIKLQNNNFLNSSICNEKLHSPTNEKIFDKIKSVLFNSQKPIQTVLIKKHEIKNEKLKNAEVIEQSKLKKEIYYGIKLGFVSVLSTIVGNIFLAYLSPLSSQVSPQKINFALKDIEDCPALDYFLFFYQTVIGGPVSEELLFRGIIYDGLKHVLNILGSTPADFISSMVSSGLFGIAHLGSRDLSRCFLTGLTSYFTELKAYKESGFISAVSCHITHNGIIVIASIILSLLFCSSSLTIRLSLQILKNFIITAILSAMALSKIYLTDKKI